MLPRGSVTYTRGRHNLRSLAAHTSPRRSAKSGTDPSMPARASGTNDCATREFAKDLPQEMESIRDHLKSPTEERGPLKGGCGVPCSWGSIVPQSPWPQPQDGTSHLRGALNTSVLCPLVLPAHTMPSTAAAPGRGVPEAVKAHLRVMSTAN